MVTGGCGCLGKEIIRQLIATNRYAVHCLDLFIPPEDKRLAGIDSYIQTDIANFSDVSRALQGMEVVFHTAGLLPYNILNTPEAMERVNLKGTKNIIKACRQNDVKRLLYTSSSSVTLSKDPKLRTEGAIDEFAPYPKAPLNAYVRTKGEAELAVREANENKLRTCALRLGAILGGVNNNRAAKATLEGKQKRIKFKGDAHVTWITLKLAAEVHLLAERYLTRETISPTNVFNVASSKSCSYKEFTSFLSILSTGKEPSELPLWLVLFLTYFNEYCFWITGIAPLGMDICIMLTDFFIPIRLSTEHTETELGWVEKRPWKDVLKECVTEYKQQE